jgi:hypothetical protein
MKIETELTRLVSAGFGGIWVRSYEHLDVQRAAAAVCKEYNWELMLWDKDKGLQIVGDEAIPDAKTCGKAVTVAQAKMRENESNKDWRGLLLLRNLHAGLDDITVLQKVQNAIEEGASQGLHVIAMSVEGKKIPAELEKLFYVVDHGFPDREERIEIIEAVLGADAPETDWESDTGRLILENTAGLSRIELEGAIGLSLYEHRGINPQMLWDEKSKAVTKDGLLTIHKSTKGFETLIGMDNVKTFVLDMFRGYRKRVEETGGKPLARPRGVALVGVPGGGKTVFALCLGKEIGWPTVILNLGSLKDKYVGNSEMHMRKVVQQLKALAPAVVFLDEADKSAKIGGAEGGSNVGDDQISELCKLMSGGDKELFFVFAGNDYKQMPAELTRSGRVNAKFIADIPTSENESALWDYYKQNLQVPDKNRPPRNEHWTGADIEAACEISYLTEYPLADSAAFVSASANDDRIQGIRDAAESEGLISTDYPGAFRKDGPPKKEEAPQRTSRRIAKKKSSKSAS